tara:strand:+ start:440 stop:865 length:426 start_codon:yes stop_codon:yes gene_type:complete
MLNIIAIVERIEEIRSNHQLSAAAFASKIGVQRSAMSHILSGRNKPSLDFLIKVYEAFDEVALDWLVLGTSTPTDKINKTYQFDSIKVENEHQQTSTIAYPKSEKIKPQKQPLISTEESASPKEIIYLYGNGSFERFTPKK